MFPLLRFLSVFGFYGAFGLFMSYWLRRSCTLFTTKPLSKEVMPGSHLLSRSLSPQYHRPAVSLPSCSGWERVFLTAASPPDKYFYYSFYCSSNLRRCSTFRNLSKLIFLKFRNFSSISCALLSNKELTHKPLLSSLERR